MSSTYNEYPGEGEEPEEQEEEAITTAPEEEEADETEEATEADEAYPPPEDEFEGEEEETFAAPVEPEPEPEPVPEEAVIYPEEQQEASAPEEIQYETGGEGYYAAPPPPYMEYPGEYGYMGEVAGEGGAYFFPSTPPATVQETEEEEMGEADEQFEPPAVRTCGGGAGDGLADDDGLKARLVESFCCQQVQIPPLLPNILKSFTKGAIRTQPRNLLQWSAAYFRALANGEVPPVKERLEYPAIQADNGLTRGLLRVLNKQLGEMEQIPIGTLTDKWKALCLETAALTNLLDSNGINGETVSWNKFLVCGAASIAKEDVGETMSIVCAVLTRQPDGVDPYIDSELWWELYTYEAQRMELESDRMEDLKTFLKGQADSNYGLIGPKDFLHQNCPSIA